MGSSKLSLALRRPSEGRGRYGGGHRSRIADTVRWLARLTVATLAVMVAGSLVPVLFGWRPYVVLSGSMAPGLRIGDIVIAAPAHRRNVRPGRIVVYASPGPPRRLIIHRVQQIGPGDTLITKGDANMIADTTPLTLAGVKGVARLRLPLIALPAYWWHIHAWLPLAAAGFLLAALIRIGYHPATEPDGDTPRDGPEAESPPGAGPAATVLDARLEVIEQIVRDRPQRCFAYGKLGPLPKGPTHQDPPAPGATAYFHGCYSVGDDQLWGTTRHREGTDHTLSALHSIRTHRPDDAPIYVILDDLPANHDPEILRWADHHKAELCYTSANPIQTELAFLAEAGNASNRVAVARELQKLLRERNRDDGTAMSAGPEAPTSALTPPEHPATARAAGAC